MRNIKAREINIEPISLNLGNKMVLYFVARFSEAGTSCSYKLMIVVDFTYWRSIGIIHGNTIYSEKQMVLKY